MIKIHAPNMALRIIDDAIQAHGGAGVSQDFELAKAYAGIRTLRLADGPDEVHARAIARIEYAKHAVRIAVAPAKAGTQLPLCSRRCARQSKLHPRLRGDDDGGSR